MSINLYIVRHGETYINKYKRIQGWTNAPLTKKEFRMANLLVCVYKISDSTAPTLLI